MARYVRVASLSMKRCLLSEKPDNVSYADYAKSFLSKHIGKVLSQKPDIIVLYELCVRPSDYYAKHINSILYYKEIFDEVLSFLCTLAREKRVYIAYPTYRFCEDGTNRNSVLMIDRDGNVMGHYDKNHIVVTETSRNNVLAGREETVFECDFGTVGVVVCFDLNFEEIRARYKKRNPDLMLFCSDYGGGMMKNFFAYDTRTYLVSACHYPAPADIIDPMGKVVASGSNYFPYCVADINLDYVVCHLDFNEGKFQKIAQKYGNKVKMDVPSFLGPCLITSESDEFSAMDLVKEFGLELVNDYIERSLKHRYDNMSDF